MVPKSLEYFLGVVGADFGDMGGMAGLEGMGEDFGGEDSEEEKPKKKVNILLNLEKVKGKAKKSF